MTYKTGSSSNNLLLNWKTVWSLVALSLKKKWLPGKDSNLRPIG